MHTLIKENKQKKALAQFLYYITTRHFLHYLFDVLFKKLMQI